MKVSHCAVPGCGNNRVFRRSMFRIPSKPDQRDSWFDFLRSVGKVIDDTKQYRICELHFEINQITSRGEKNILVYGAVPILDNFNKRKTPLIVSKTRKNFLMLNDEDDEIECLYQSSGDEGPSTSTKTKTRIAYVPSSSVSANASDMRNMNEMTAERFADKFIDKTVMIASEFRDTDSYKLRFESKCTESDKKWFRHKYPKVDTVSSEKLHCTTCDMHIGTAPISEKIIRTHLILNVTQCNKCFAFYNSGEFGKGEDGSEYYCRWCGQGGEVFCCATCPYVFCNKCIKVNLSDSYVKEIEENDDWSCFVCNKDVLKNLRAQHWALRNFMTKQLEKIQKTTVATEDELSNLLNEDASECCPKKKRKSIVQRPAPAPVKRGMSGGYITTQPPAKKLHSEPAPKQARTYSPAPKPIALPKAGGSQSSIVCTPDILGLFNDNNAASSSGSAPPPLAVMKQPLRVRMRGSEPATTPPIYHNISGFQIDLNHAARQEIFRLPNGKLIQVRKQPGASPNQGQQVRGQVNIQTAKGPQFTIRQASPSATATLVNNIRTLRPPVPPQPRVRGPLPQQPRFSFANGRMVATPILHPTPTAALAPTPAPPKQSQSTIFTQQNGTISVARAQHPDTPFGKAKIAFEDKVINGLEICQHTINKMITLSNASSFKESRNFSDLKDLYIHLNYLFSFTSGKIKTLQEELTAGMEKLDTDNAANKEKTDVDELEILEEKTDVIEVLSDGEEEEPVKVPEPVAATPAPAKPAPLSQKPGPLSRKVVGCGVAVIKKPILKHIQYNEPEKTDEAPELLPTLSSVSSSTISLPDEEKSNSSLPAGIIDSDVKLSKKVLVKVEKLEDSKNTIIQMFLKTAKERLDAMASVESSREATPDLPDMLMNIDVGLEEQDVDTSSVNEEASTANDDSEKENSMMNENAVEEVKEPEKSKDDHQPVIDEANAIEIIPKMTKEADVLKIGDIPPAHLLDSTDDEAKNSETDEAAKNSETDEVAKNSETDEAAKNSETDEAANNRMTDEGIKDSMTDEGIKNSETDEAAKSSETDEAAKETEKVVAVVDDEQTDNEVTETTKVDDSVMLDDGSVISIDEDSFEKLPVTGDMEQSNGLVTPPDLETPPNLEIKIADDPLEQANEPMETETSATPVSDEKPNEMLVDDDSVKEPIKDTDGIPTPDDFMGDDVNFDQVNADFESCLKDALSTVQATFENGNMDVPMIETPTEQTDISTVEDSFLKDQPCIELE